MVSALNRLMMRMIYNIDMFICRIMADTPDWFKRIRKKGIKMVAVATALMAANGTIPTFHLPTMIYTFCQWAIISGITAAVISSTATNEDIKK